MLKNNSIHNQTIPDFAQGGYLKIAFDSFIIDRRAAGLTKQSIEFYQGYLDAFLSYCNRQSVTHITQVTPDFIRRYLLSYEGIWKPGGIHASFRTLRAFFRWLDFEDVMDSSWKNPILKVKGPRVPEEIIEPISMQDVETLINSCKGQNIFSLRDKAIFLCLLDTGARAQEFCNINLADLDLDTGSIVIRMGKGRKPRTVFIGKKSKKAVRAYLRERKDKCPVLFASQTDERLTYDGLAQILERHAKRAGLKVKPSLHDFRRAFALTMLRNGVNIFALQRLMGHADLSILRRYLAQTDVDIQEAHLLGSPVDKSL